MRLTLTSPPRALSPNRIKNLHHFQRARLVRDYRGLIKVEALVALATEPRPRFEKAQVWARIYHPRKSYFLDPDNAAAWLKRMYDGLEDAGIFATDRELTHFPVVQRVDKVKAGTTELSILK